MKRKLCGDCAFGLSTKAIPIAWADRSMVKFGLQTERSTNAPGFASAKPPSAGAVAEAGGGSSVKAAADKMALIVKLPAFSRARTS